MNNQAEKIERRFEVPIVVGALLVIPILFVDGTRRYVARLREPKGAP
jgi:hypothetical protein